MDRREAAGPGPEEDRDLLDVLMSIRAEDGELRFSADEVTGIFISMMFAGHHTTSTTASWMVIELLRHEGAMDLVVAELDALFEDSDDVSYQALRAMPQMEAALKETLRMHPPLILLLRVAKVDLDVEGRHIAAGEMVGASPWISNRIPEDFPEPDSFDPSRYLAGREEDKLNPWTWIPFGAGRHRCVGASFALMQLKAIFSVVLPSFELSLAQPPESYQADMSKMVIQLEQPVRIRYRRRGT